MSDPIDTAAVRAAYSLPCSHDNHPVYRDLNRSADDQNKENQ